MAGVTGGVHTAIVLQDGGVLGVHECGVLTAFREQRPGFEPVAVTGISICAVTAAVPGGARTDLRVHAGALREERFTVSPPLGWLLRPVDRALTVLGDRGRVPAEHRS